MNLSDYIKGLRKGKNAHHIEREAMKDPFLSDALDGYDAVEGDHIEKIAQLQKKIEAKSKRKTNYRLVWTVAAGLLLCIGIGGFFFLSRNNNEELYSKLEEPTETVSEQAETIKTIVPAESTKQIKPQASPEIIIAQATTTRAIKSKEKAAPPIVVKDVSSEEAGAVNSSKDEILVAPPIQLSLAEVQETIQSSTTPIITQLQGKMAGAVVSASAKESSTHPGKISLKGRVVDESGEPLIGVSIVQKNSSRGTVSDIDGNFALNDLDPKIPVEVNYLGFESVEIPAQTNKDMLIAMREDSKQLDEVVVVGYGTSKKADMSYSSSEAKKEKSSEKKKKSEPETGVEAYKQYLKENAVLPASSACEEKKGKVKLQFYIDTNGRPHNIKVKKSLCPDADNEAIRLINQGSDWIYGIEEVTVEVEFK